MAETENKTRFVIKIVIILFILLGALLALAELGTNFWSVLKGS